MARRRFPKEEDIEDFEQLEIEPEQEGSGSFDSGLSPQMQSRIQGVTKKALSVLKLMLGLSFLTFVYSSTKAFVIEFRNVPVKFQDPLWEGIVAFVIVFFFVWEPVKFYQRGQKILEFVFKFTAPLVKVAPYVLPVYTILLFCLYPLANFFFPYDETLAYFMFMFGFTIALHLVFGAKSLRTKQSDFLKANYIFGFTLVFIIDVVLFGLCMNLLFEQFSFVNFMNTAFKVSHEIILAVVKQVLVLN